jgi:hypothetical protein
MLASSMTMSSSAAATFTGSGRNAVAAPKVVRGSISNERYTQLRAKPASSANTAIEVT